MPRRPPSNPFPPLTRDELAVFNSDPALAQRFPPLLTVSQAAELAQVPKATVYDWSSRGLLGGCSCRAGKHLRIWRDRFIKQIFEKGVGRNE